MTEPLATVYHADCVEVLRELAPDSIDALATDPPAGIEFMGKAWDTFSRQVANPSGPQTEEWHSSEGETPYARRATPRFTGKRGSRDVEARENFIGALTVIAAECYRVMKPGAHGVVWAIPRTAHWTTTALEDAGFEVRDVIAHHFGQGFPKSMDVSKAIDKAAGAERKVVGPPPYTRGKSQQRYEDGRDVSYNSDPQPLTEPATSDAERWAGWGTALKPATEFWVLIRKPLSARSVAANVLEHGTGALNIDESRVASPGARLGGGRVSSKSEGWDRPWKHDDEAVAAAHERGKDAVAKAEKLGRWPANLLLSHAPECELVGTKRIKGIRGSGDAGRMAGKTSDVYGRYEGVEDAPKEAGFVDAEGMEEVEEWVCVEGCPVALIDEQSGTLKSGKPAGGSGPHRATSSVDQTGGLYEGGADGSLRKAGVEYHLYGDRGGASRFFANFHPLYYQPKAAKKERNAGLPEGMVNDHPTVKPVGVMAYLVRLITPPGGTVLDPLMGSGSTGVAALDEGFEFVGVEREAKSYVIAKLRIANSGEVVDGKRHE